MSYGYLRKDYDWRGLGEGETESKIIKSYVADFQ